MQNITSSYRKNNKYLHFDISIDTPKPVSKPLKIESILGVIMRILRVIARILKTKRRSHQSQTNGLTSASAYTYTGV